MTVTINRPCLVVLAGLILSGCMAMRGSPPVAPQDEMSGQAETEQAETGAGTVTSQTIVAPPSLTYSWDTEFSAFLTPPIEVRRLAKNDCVSEGYEIAVVKTMKLEGNMATALFICRGDFE